MAEGNFDEITERLDEIIAQVRSKDTSLERSLDLFDEAIELGSPREADMLDAELATEAQSEQPAEQAETDPKSSGA